MPADADLDDVGDQRPGLVDRVVAHEALDGVHGVGVEHGLGQAGRLGAVEEPEGEHHLAPASAEAMPVSMPSAPACRSQALASQLTALPWVGRP